MSQLTIYLPDSELREVKRVARRRKMSVSEWVRRKIGAGKGTLWPEGYLAVIGSVRDATLKRPPQPPAADDTARKAM